MERSKLNAYLKSLRTDLRERKPSKLIDTNEPEHEWADFIESVTKKNKKSNIKVLEQRHEAMYLPVKSPIQSTAFPVQSRKGAVSRWVGQAKQ